MESDRDKIRKNYRWIFEMANDRIGKSLNSQDQTEINKYRMDAINFFRKIVDSVDIREYLLLDSKPEIPEDVLYESYFKLGTLYKTCVETQVQKDIALRKQNEANRNRELGVFSKECEDMFRLGLECFRCILRIRFEDKMSLEQITSIYTYMSLFADNLEKCLGYMQEALLYVPGNATIHYNLGYVYQRLNRLEISLIHYKISLSLINNSNITISDENRCLCINNYNGISAIYRSLKQWPEALYYLLEAQKIDGLDPDIQNQLGVVYTEMRRTDLAEIAYNRGIKNYNRAFVSTDKKFLLSEMYLNLGHMHSYNGDNYKSVDCYNKSLQTCPKFNLPFQNKIMNLNYLFDELDDKMYITNQHKLVNKLYKKMDVKFDFGSNFYNMEKINVGIISGDFVDHPVSFFIGTFLRNFNASKFTVTCYSECIINTGLYNEKLRFKTIKNLSAQDSAKLIYNDNIHILFDLAGHTAFNRLDIFALKPSPIQITYIGYPFTTGLEQMDYRITDNICDGDFSISQKFYTERLIAMKNCFLCYDPIVTSNSKEEDVIKVDKLGDDMRKRDGYINIGCFNRINKITGGVIKLLNDILLKIPKTRLILKTKALINNSIKDKFIEKFSSEVRDRIIVLDCTLTHQEHLLTYKSVDIAVDTFPYSGTTTTCESLYMGVPVFSVYDDKYYFHPQNVSCSILKNSGLDEYVIHNRDDIFEKIISLVEQVDNYDFWKILRVDIRSKFTGGLVCNKIEYMKNLERLLEDLYNEKRCN